MKAEAERLRQSVAAEVKQYQSKRHEMVLARAKHEHEDKLHKNKAELLQTAINEQVEKHIEAAYKDYLERGRGEGAGAAGGGAGARKGDPGVALRAHGRGGFRSRTLNLNETLF